MTCFYTVQLVMEKLQILVFIFEICKTWNTCVYGCVCVCMYSGHWVRKPCNVWSQCITNGQKYRPFWGWFVWFSL